jgi:hypothetical protein
MAVFRYFQRKKAGKANNRGLLIAPFLLMAPGGLRLTSRFCLLHHFNNRRVGVRVLELLKRSPKDFVVVDDEAL